MSQLTRPEGRVPRLSAEHAAEGSRKLDFDEKHAQLNLNRVLLQHPTLAKPLLDLLLTLVFHGRLDERLRELVIMRVGWLTGSDYEWTQHWRVATDLGIDAADLLAVRDGPSPERLGEAERAVLQATDETLADGAIGAATWARLQKWLPSDEERIELVTVIGAWRMMSSLLRSLEIPLEDGVASWPPDGVAPTNGGAREGQWRASTSS